MQGDNLAGRVKFAEATEQYKMAQEDFNDKESKVKEIAKALTSAPNFGSR